MPDTRTTTARPCCPNPSLRDGKETTGPGSCIRRCFSLFELLIVLAIIGTASALAVPRMMTSESIWRLQGASQRVAADLAEARAHAIASSASVKVIYTRNGYIIRDAANQIVREVRLTQRPYDVEVSLVSFAAGEVSFNGHGVGSADGVVTLATDGLLCRIALNAISGSVKIGDIETESEIRMGGGGGGR
ncbi:MAG: GspH/FimT family pseudopilin [Phycisphaeraceae bacterium]|nr:MAG: GspH/FimT family pseudopilin [Phycisphaeraceae bacterium]